MAETRKKLYSVNYMAEVFGISQRYMQKLAKEGTVPSVKDSHNRYKFDLIPTVKAYIDYISNLEKPETPDDARRKKADADWKRARADMEQLKLAELRGQMHRSEDVEAAVTDMGAAFRAAFLALPGRVAIDVSHATTPMEASAIIKDAVNDTLNSLMQYQYDPEFYAQRVREREKWIEQKDDEDDDG